MISEKLIRFILLQLAFLKGYHFSNSTEGPTDRTSIEGIILTTEAPPSLNTTDLTIFKVTNTTGAYLNSTGREDSLNSSSVNLTFREESRNETFKSNYTMVADAIGSSEDFPEFRLQKSAAIAAGVFLVSAVIGYLSCVSYRRYLQRKYGNSQILITEDAYDTTDLKNFEI